MAAREGRRTRADELDVVLATLAEGLRVLAVLLWPYLPASTERLLAALGAPDARRSPSAELGAGAGRARVDALEPLFPKDAPAAAAP